MIIDETVNITIEKPLIAYLRIVKDDRPQTVFFGYFTVKDVTADTITATVYDALSSRGINFDKLIGFASDGVSIMTGHHNGVGVKL